MAGLPNWFDQGMNNPLTHLGLGLTQSMAPRYSTNIADLNGGGLGAGLLAGVNSYQGHKRGQLQDSIRSGLLQAKQQEALLKQQEAQRESQEAQALEDAIAKLPPEQQAWARLNPAAAVKAIAGTKGQNGLFGGTGMEAQRANAILRRGIANFKASNPDASPEETANAIQKMKFDLASRAELQPSPRGIDTVTGQMLYTNPSPLPAWVTTSFPRTPEGETVPGMTAPTGQQAPRTPGGQTVPGMTAASTGGVVSPPAAQSPSMPNETMTPDQVLAETPIGAYVSPEHIKALGRPEGTIMQVVASPGGKKSFSTPQYPPKPTDAQKKRNADLETATASLSRIRALIDPENEKAVDPSSSIFALASEIGSSPKIRGLLPNAIEPELSKEQAELAAELGQYHKAYIAMIRGAQVGPKEEESFLRVLPQIGQNPKVFAANLAASEKNIETMSKALSGKRTSESMSADQRARLEAYRRKYGK